jgi:hypothetical protein
VLTIEHRAAPAPDPFRLQLATDGDVHLTVVEPPSADDAAPCELDRLVLDLLRRVAQPVSRSQLRAELHVRNERLGDTLLRLTAAGAVIRTGDRWAVPVPTP